MIIGVGKSPQIYLMINVFSYCEIICSESQINRGYFVVIHSMLEYIPVNSLFTMDIDSPWIFLGFVSEFFFEDV